MTTPSPFAAAVGTELGVSGWVDTGQQLVDNYAALVGDRGPIHNEPDSEAARSLGGTIVQGTFLLAKIPSLIREVHWPTADIAYRLHYGYDRIRFIEQVPTGSRVRARVVLRDVDTHDDHAEKVTLDITIEVEGSDRPAAVAEMLAYVRYAS